MRPSRLFGTLEAPGQKEYPSKNIDYWKLNPKQPTQIETVTVQKKLSNGRVWTMGGEMPLTTTDTFPRLNPEGTWRHLSQGTGSFGSPFKASNPETITSFGILPQYPEEQAMRAALMARPKVRAEVVGEKEVFPKAEKPEISLPKITSKFTPEKLERLAQMGIPEELIGKAIEEELKKDMMAFLNNPALLAEVQTTEAIQQIYEKYVTKQRAIKTGENAPGDAPGAGSQNVGTRIGANAAEMSMLSAKKQRQAEMRAKQLGAVTASVLAGVAPEDMAGYNPYLRPMASALGEVPLLHRPDLGAGAGGGGLSMSAFGMLAGTMAGAPYRAQEQEAEEEEEYAEDHSLMENAEGAAAAAGMSAFAAEAVGAVKGKGGRKPKPSVEQLQTLFNQVSTGKKQQTINGTIQSLRQKGVPESEIQDTIRRAQAKMGGGGGGGLLDF